MDEEGTGLCQYCLALQHFKQFWCQKCTSILSFLFIYLFYYLEMFLSSYGKLFSESGGFAILYIYH